jgi:hypothetical protein
MFKTLRREVRAINGAGFVIVKDGLRQCADP